MLSKKAKGLFISFSLFILFLFLPLACGSSPREKYKSSFEKIWNNLGKEEQKLSDELPTATSDIDKLLSLGEKRSQYYRKTKQELEKLHPPDDLRKLHRLMIDALNKGIRYFDEANKLLKETQGNYSEKDLERLKKLEDSWREAAQKVKKEIKAQGWVFK